MDTFNIDIVKEMFVLFRANDKEGLRKLFSPALEWNQMEGFPGGGSYKGIDAVFENVFSRLKEEWTEWKAVAENFIECHNLVMVQGYYQGTYNITQNSFNALFLHIYTVENGRITRFQQYTDTYKIFEAMQQG